MSHRYPIHRRAFIGAAVLAVHSPPLRGADDRVPTPPFTEGPFYPTKLPVDTDNDLVLINKADGRALGTIAHVSGRILDKKGQPIRNAVIEIWQCDHNGAYLHAGSANGSKRDAGFQGFGRFTTAASGEYYFRTIQPVPYPGRTPHIHIKILRAGKELLTTQMFVQGHAQNARDGIFRAIRDEKVRAAAQAEFKPLDGRTGEVTAHFDVVLGVAPEV